MRTEDVLGYPVVSRTAGELVAEIARRVAMRQGTAWLACFNPHSYAESLRNPHFASALRAADWLVADGVGVVLASRALGGKIPERVTGFDIFRGVNAELDASGGGRVFFLGSTPAVLATITSNMARDYPRLTVAGTYSPPFTPSFSPLEIDEMVSAVNGSHADVLWVGMTAPKQEMWIAQVRDRLDVRFVAAIGAVFDFYSGRIKRASPRWQRLGLEWLPRLLQEPRRLWRRMLVSAPIFVRDVARQRLRLL